MNKREKIFGCGLVFILSLVVYCGCASTPIVPTRPYYTSPTVEGSIVTFKLWAPNAGSVYLLGDFNAWKINPNYKLLKTPNDIWSTSVRLGPGSYKYSFSVDGQQRVDSVNPDSVGDGAGNRVSVLTIH
ncbi:MAG: glycogen-binding domain-containing protein [Proteobacteria bacterium]|nr:glycogen-binding domain-containing protein [Pseudomonadota bacterium]